MKINRPHHAPAVTSSLLLGIAFLGSSAMAQDSYSFIDGQTTNQPASAIFRIAPSSILNEQAPMLRLSIARSVEQKDFEGAVVDEALSFNLGMQIEPIAGLNVTADAWSLQIDEATGSKHR